MYEETFKPDAITTIFLAPSAVGRDQPLLPQDWQQRKDNNKELVVVMYSEIFELYKFG